MKGDENVCDSAGVVKNNWIWRKNKIILD